MKVEIKKQDKRIPETVTLHVHEETDSIRNLVEFIEQERFRISSLVCNRGEAIHKIAYKDIDFIESVQEVQQIHVGENVYTTRRRLYELERLLPPEFARVSKSVLLNMKKVKMYQPTAGGIMLAVLKNGTEVYISRKYLKGLRVRIKEGLV